MSIILNPITGITYSDGTTQQNAGHTSYRNIVENGDFRIWQEGNTNNGTLRGGADRWVQQNTTGESINTTYMIMPESDRSIFKDEFVPQFCRISAPAGTTQTSGVYILLLQKSSHGVETFSGKTVTLSFWARSSINRAIALEIQQQFGTGGTPSAAVNTKPSTNPLLTPIWKKFSVTLSLPSITGKTLGTNGDDNVAILFFLSAGTSFDARTNNLGFVNGDIDITSIQLEEGSTATPFEVRPYEEELLMCQRYKQVGISLLMAAYGVTGNLTEQTVSLPVTMASIGTVTVTTITTQTNHNPAACYHASVETIDHYTTHTVNGYIVSGIQVKVSCEP